MHCVLLTWHSSRVRTLGKLLVDECEGKGENLRIDGRLLAGFIIAQDFYRSHNSFDRSYSKQRLVGRGFLSRSLFTRLIPPYKKFSRMILICRLKL